MKNVTAGLICLVLAAAPAMAQDKSADKKGKPLTAEERAAKTKNTNEKGARCNGEARKNKLTPGTKEFAAFMGKCQLQ
jgi:hypothetical protein